MIQYFSVKQNGSVLETTSAESFDWVHLETPSLKEIEKIAQDYSVPKDYLTAVLDKQEVPRTEGLNQQTLEQPILLLCQYPHPVTSPSGFQQFEMFPFSMILTKEKIITACNYATSFTKKFHRILSVQEHLLFPEQIAIQISWNIASLFNKNVQELKKETENLESQLRVSVANQQLYQIMDIQKSLVYFKSALQENLRGLESLLSTSLLLDSKDARAALHDVLVENKQALTITSIQLQLVSQTKDMFSAIVSNNLNIIMKVLTSITVVLTIPTIIGGLYGMNVHLPFANFHNAFWWLCGGIVLLCLFTTWLLKKKNLF